MCFLFKKKSAPAYESYNGTAIPPRFLEYLKESGQYDPGLRNRDEAIGYVLADADDHKRALLYAYAVDCARHGCTMGNVLREKKLPQYKAFADQAVQSPEFMRSLDRMGTWSYWSPGTSTNAYKLAAKWFP